ncbi:MAG: septum formation initiator family protein [Desulfobacterales bacterium]|nr:septum formation initiator family protein [Desulfobacterales bacterium]
MKQFFYHIIALSILVATLILIIYGNNGWRDLYRLSEKRDQIIEDSIRLNRENKELSRIIHRLRNDHDYIEYIAREELGMIRSDEMILIFNEQE